MGLSLTFIHAADLHLGSPLKSLHALDSRIGIVLTSALSSAYDRLVSEAIQRHVDFVAISGDVFDSARPSYACVMHFIDGMNALCDAGIPVYLATGNHDKLDAWEQGFASLPSNVTLFSQDQPAFTVFKRDEQVLATIAGKGYTQAPCSDVALRMGRRSARRLLTENAPFHVALLHTGLDLDTSICPVTPAQLLEADADYWALGHIHKRFCNDAASPRVAYPGCIQGRDINEPGDCGCLCVTISEGAANRIEFIPLSTLCWERISIDVSAMENVVQVQTAIENTLAQLARERVSKKIIARVGLTGKGVLHNQLSRTSVREDLRERINELNDVFFCDSIECRMVAAIDRDLLYDQGLFPAALLSSIDALRTHTTSANSLIEQEFAARGLDPLQLDAADFDSLFNSAEDLLLTLLAGESYAE